MADIFISYARKDRSRADAIAAALKREGWTVWWDQNIPVGKKFSKVIGDEIKRSKCVVVLWSTASVSSDWVLDEAEEGKTRQILVPILIEAVLPPWGFRQLQTADLSSWNGAADHPEFLALRHAIAAILQQAASTPAPSQPIDSEQQLPKETRALQTNSAGDFRLRLLSKIQRERIEPRLRQGLREAIRVDLGLRETPSAVPATLRKYRYLESGGSYEDAPVTGPVRQVFEDATRQLLILGDPGTGKTNLLLELAQTLIDDAREQSDFPIPIVFSLPRWTLRSSRIHSPPAIGSWLRDELVTEYGLSPAVAEKLISHDSILPLLDGLDEVDEKWRAECVLKINDYQRDRNLGALAICCRYSEYQELPQLVVSTAVCIDRMSRDDVHREISKPGLEFVKRAMDADPELWTFVDTPLRLHVLYAAAQVDARVDLDGADLQTRLYGRYLEYAVRRTAPESPRARTSRDVLIRRLSWLADWMRRSNQTEFVLGDLDYMWLISRQGVVVQLLLQALVLGVVAGVMGGYAIGIASGLGGMTLSAASPAVWTLYFRWRFLRNPRARPLMTAPLTASIAISASLTGLSYGLLGVVVAYASHTRLGTGWGIRLGIIAASCSAATSLLYHPLWRLIGRVGDQGRPMIRYFGLTRSLADLGLWIALTVAGRTGSLDARILLFALPLAAGWFCSSFADFAVGRHLVQLTLWLRGAAPLRYAPFLNEAVERLFLIRRGRSFEFLHITFRDYMAGLARDATGRRPPEKRAR